MVDVVSRHDVRVLSGTDALQAYAGLIDGLACPPPQYAEWIEAWTRNVNPDLAVVSLQDSGAVLAVLPLEIVRKGPLKLAQFPGASHANGNFVPLRRDSTLAAADIEAMIAALRKARPDIDLIVLDRQLHQHAGLANPWENVPHQISPNISLAVGLEGGFEALMTRTSGKRKRKKQRAQLRKFEAIGPVRRWMAQTDGEVTQLLDFFFANKALRLKAMGVPNVFGEADVQAFFRALFAPQNRFVLHALDVGGKTRALTGSSLLADRIICEFGVIAQDDTAAVSPGDFLFFQNIEEACAQGLAVYDFSAGDEYFKRLWCDQITTQFDTIVGLSLKGRLAAAVLKARGAAVRTLKSNTRLWAFVRRMRRKPVQAVQADDESA